MLDAVFEQVRKRERHLRVYSDSETDLDEQFASYNVDVATRELPPGGPAPFLVVEEGGEFAGAISLSALDGLLEPPVVRPGAGDELSAGYRILFEVLDETIFRAMNRRQLLAVSREIEDRAYRTGHGTLRVSFQTLSTFESQLETYRHLVGATDLDVHVHGVADWAPPAVSGLTYHAGADDTVGRYWTLAFDGGGDETRTCALVARERPDGYDGFWTDDPELVAEILNRLADAQAVGS